MSFDINKIDALELEASIYRDSFYEFFKWSFSILEPSSEFQDNWHYEYICDLLQKEVERISRGEPAPYNVIIINVPPRSGKSYIVARDLNAWAWIRFPYMKFIGTSYSDSLAKSHALDTRRIIRSEKYQKLFGTCFSMAKDQDGKERFDTTAGGMRLVMGVGGATTGEGGDIIICDDPVNPRQADSATWRDNANRWWDQTFFSRLNNDKVGVRILVMQRLHESDLTGYILKKIGENYRVLHVNLPAKLSPDVSPASVADKYHGGLLFPSKLGENELQRQFKSLGPYGYASQYQQKPSPEGGGKIKRSWFPIISPKSVPEGLIRYYYTDPSEGKLSSDEMASGCWSVTKDGNIIIHEMISVRLPFTKFIGLWEYDNVAGAWRCVEEGEYDRFVKRNGSNSQSLHYMEAKSVGQSYVDYGKVRTPYLWRGDNPGSDSKEVRAYSAIPTLFAGKVLLVDGPWVEPFLHEVENFPVGDEDGMVDVLASMVRKSDLTITEDTQGVTDSDETEDSLLDFMMNKK